MNPDILQQTIAYVKKVFETDFSGHDYFHTLRVFRLASGIAQEEGAELLPVQLAALLHDVDDRKLSPATAANKDRARAFLAAQGADSSMIERIITIISEVSFQGSDSVVPSTLEGCCVQDADRLDALGAIGIARTFAYGGSHSRVMHDPEEQPLLHMTGEEYASHVSSSVNHFHEKLFLLKDMICTPSARKIAQSRDAYMHAFLAEFLQEWDGLR